GAGMILGAAIFSSIFFYGSIMNSITVQDMINNVEAEVSFSPTGLEDITDPSQLADLIVQEEEFEDTVVIYGVPNYGDRDPMSGSFYTNIQTTINYTYGIDEYPIFFSPIIFDADYIDHPIVDRVNLAAGEPDLTGDGCFLSIEKHTDFGIQINDTIPINVTIIKSTHIEERLITTNLNLTVRGFYREGMLFGSDLIMFSSDNLGSDFIGNFTTRSMYMIAAKLDLTKLPLGNLNDLNEAIDVVIRRVEQKYQVMGSNRISGILSFFQIFITIMQIINTVLYIPAIVLSIILVNLGAELALQERKFEVSVLKAQGASPKQIRRMILSEVFMVGIIGEVIGIFLGTIGAAMVISTFRFMSIDFGTFSIAYRSLQIKPVAIIFTVIVTLGLLFIATIRKTNNFIRQEVAVATTIQRERRRWFKKIYGDVIFFFLGLIGVALTIATDINPTISFSFIIGLVQAFTPILLWYGAAGVASRLSTKIPEILDKVLVRVFKDIGVLLKGSLSRRHQNYPRITVLLCLSISLCVFTAIQGETSAAELTRQADFIVGGDMRVDLFGQIDSVSISNFTGFEDKIESIIPIYYTVFVSGVTPVDCYGLDLTEYGDEALWHRDSIVGYRNWNEGLQRIQDNPLRNIGVGSETATYLETRDSSSFFLTLLDETQIPVDAVIEIDHAPGGLREGEIDTIFFDFTYSYFMLVDKQFIIEHAPYTHTIARAIINLKSGVDPVDENLIFQFTSQFDWIVDAYAYDEVLLDIQQSEGRSFGFPGLLTIDFIVSLIAAIIGVFIFMYMIINRRKKEFAILISEGASRGQLVKLVLTEVFSMAIFATMFGTFIGFLLGYQFNGFFEQFSTAVFNRMLVFPPVPIVGTILGGFGVIIIATLIPAIVASRTNVVEEMRTF
ncbi:MAG: ABC transporter permease, partial [Candidatus Heimdallarchaeaceae archaeon]